MANSGKQVISKVISKSIGINLNLKNLISQLTHRPGRLGNMSKKRKSSSKLTQSQSHSHSHSQSYKYKHKKQRVLHTHTNSSTNSSPNFSSNSPTYLDTLIDTYYDNDKVCESYLKTAAKRIHIYPRTSRIIVIGDIHGDFHAAIKCLVLAKVIEVTTMTPNTHSTIEMTNFFKSMRWIGANTYVVQLGDQIDRVRAQHWDSNNIALDTAFDDEGSTLELFYLFTYLDTLAQEHDGHVFSILGNHEIMNTEGDFRYVSAREFNAFSKQLKSTYYYKSKFPYNSLTLKKNMKILNNNKIKKPDGYRERLYSFAPTGICANLLGVNYYTMLQVGSWLFCHGGPTFATISKYNIELLNNIVSFHLLGLDTKTKDIYHNYCEIIKPKLSNKLSNKSSALDSDGSDGSDGSDDSDGVFWSRKYSNIGKPLPNKESQLCNEIDKALKAYNILNNPSTPSHHIAVGHSPQHLNNLGMNSICNGRVWRCDVGMSKAFGESDLTDKTRLPQVLEIINDNEVTVLSFT
jgi:hypothetical protein